MTFSADEFCDVISLMNRNSQIGGNIYAAKNNREWRDDIWKISGEEGEETEGQTQEK